VVKALSETLGQSQQAAEKWIDGAEDNFSLTIENFCKWVKEYLDSKGPQHRIIFLVDEVGQFIGSDSHLMLNLQTITEELGTVCRRRAWVVVTSWKVTPYGYKSATDPRLEIRRVSRPVFNPHDMKWHPAQGAIVGWKVMRRGGPGLAFSRRLQDAKVMAARFWNGDVEQHTTLPWWNRIPAIMRDPIVATGDSAALKVGLDYLEAHRFPFSRAEVVKRARQWGLTRPTAVRRQETRHRNPGNCQPGREGPPAFVS
jgi:hypothetical protein